jgi:flagellar protein FliO/FliZ
MIAATLAVALGTSMFLPVGLLATQITISEVSAERQGAQLGITVKGDAMIDPEAASTKMADGQLYLLIRDARVREANRAWKNDAVEGADDIRAHRHKFRIELAIPLAGSGCQGSVELQKSPEGLRALIDCNEAPRPAVARAARSAVVAKDEPAGEAKEAAKSEAKSESNSESKAQSRLVTSPAAPQGVTSVHLSERETAALKAKLVLAPSRADPDTEGDADGASPGVKAAPATRSSAKVPAASTAAASPAVPAPPQMVVAPAPRPAALAAVPAPVVVAAPAARPAVVAVLPGLAAPPISGAALAPAASMAPTPGAFASGSSGSGGMALAGLALLAIAGGAFFFSRRRTLGNRTIQILETASLGPKRSLIVARVGDATLILGSSEAGIALLQTLPQAPAELSTAALAESIAAIPFGDSPVEVSFFAADPAGASAAASPLGMLTSVPVVAMPGMKIDVQDVTGPFSRVETNGGDDENQPVGQAGLLSRLFRRGTPANDATAPRFEDMLEDSFEDQELRRKLSLGLSGRVR